MKSWKTTIAGIGSIATGIGIIAKAIHDGDYSQLGAGIAAFTGGVGLIMARDNDKSSEDVGVQK